MPFLPSLNSHKVVAAHHAFEALIQVEVEHESPAEIRMVDLRVLAIA